MVALPQLAVRAFVLAAFWIPMALCMIVAWTPDPRSGLAASASGVVAHLAAFAYLSAALCRAHFDAASDARLRLFAVALWMFAFGVVIEVVQMLFVSGRSGDLGDLATDAAGIVAGCAIYSTWRARMPAAA